MLVKKVSNILPINIIQSKHAPVPVNWVPVGLGIKFELMRI